MLVRGVRGLHFSIGRLAGRGALQLERVSEDEVVGHARGQEAEAARVGGHLVRVRVMVRVS